MWSETENDSMLLWTNVSSFSSSSYSSVTNLTSNRMLPTPDSSIKHAILPFFLATFAFGVFGNTLVMYVIAKFPRIRMRSVSNYYIWNLALADELLVLTLPFYCYATYANDWIFGTVACKVG